MLLYLKKTLWVCFACLMAGFLAFSAFAMQDFLLVLALAAVLAAAFFLAARRLAACSRPQALKWPLRAGYALFFVALCVFGLLALPSPHSDLAAVYGAIPDVLDNFTLDGAYADYFVYYYNNIALLLLFSGLYALAGVFGFEFAGNASMGLAVVFSAAVLACTVVLLCKLVAQAAGRGGRPLEALALLLCALCLPFYFYTPVFYTDAFAMFFLVAEAWLLFRFSRSGRLAAAAACGAVAGLGVLMKGTLAVPVVALAISICFMGSQAVKKRLAGLAALAGAFALAVAVPAWLVLHSGLADFSRYDALGLPVQTWMCMSVHGGGAYCQDCVDYARSFPTMAARTQAMQARLAGFYQSYSLPEYLRFSARKTATVWCDGSYEALLYLKWPQQANAFNALFTGSCRGFWVWCNAYLVMLYGLNLAGVLASFRQKEWDIRFFLRLSVFGLFLYFFLMEAAARRALMVLPALLLGAASALWHLASKDKARTGQPGRAACPVVPLRKTQGGLGGGHAAACFAAPKCPAPSASASINICAQAPTQPEITLPASIRPSSITSNSPAAASRVHSSAAWAPLACSFFTTSVMPLPMAQGVLGIMRTMGHARPAISARRASESPAAMLTRQNVSPFCWRWRNTGAISAKRPAIICGFTPSKIYCACAAASPFDAATAQPYCCASASAFCGVRLERMHAAPWPPFAVAATSAPPMFPVPRNASLYCAIQ